MGLVDGDLSVVEDSAEAALLSSLEKAGLTDEHIVTIYWGADIDSDTVEEVAGKVEEQAPGIQVDLVYGGQPHYPYFISVE